MTETHRTAQEIYRDFIAKSGGPGSRGGQVLGQTTSGRPIYARRASGHATYAGLSARDHFEAARAHLGRVGVLNSRARATSKHGPVTPQEKALAAKADRHMAHFRGHMQRAKRLNATIPAPHRMPELA